MGASVDKDTKVVTSTHRDKSLDMRDFLVSVLAMHQQHLSLTNFKALDILKCKNNLNIMRNHNFNGQFSMVYFLSKFFDQQCFDLWVSILAYPANCPSYCEFSPAKRERKSIISSSCSTTGSFLLPSSVRFFLSSFLSDMLLDMGKVSDRGKKKMFVTKRSPITN